MKITIKDSKGTSVKKVETGSESAQVEVKSVGPAGRPGERGEKGEKGETVYFEFHQSIPEAEWTIYHYLNVFPSVTVVDSAGSTVYGETVYLSRNHLQLRFGVPFAGSAYLN